MTSRTPVSSTFSVSPSSDGSFNNPFRTKSLEDIENEIKRIIDAFDATLLSFAHQMKAPDDSSCSFETTNELFNACVKLSETLGHDNLKKILELDKPVLDVQKYAVMTSAYRTREGTNPDSPSKFQLEEMLEKMRSENEHLISELAALRGQVAEGSTTSDQKQIVEENRILQEQMKEAENVIKDLEAEISEKDEKYATTLGKITEEHEKRLETYQARYATKLNDEMEKKGKLWHDKVLNERLRVYMYHQAFLAGIDSNYLDKEKPEAIKSEGGTAKKKILLVNKTRKKE